MLKQYRVREGKIFEYIIELYHDGKLVNTEKVWASDKEGKINILENEGAICDHALNGEIALTMFSNSKEGTYDVILMDVQMPTMNGYKAASAIRGSGHIQANTIPIAAMTANAFKEDVQNALNSGMNAHIAKPINMEVLRKTVCGLLNKQVRKGQLSEWRGKGKKVYWV